VSTTRWIAAAILGLALAGCGSSGESEAAGRAVGVASAEELTNRQAADGELAPDDGAGQDPSALAMAADESTSSIVGHVTGASIVAYGEDGEVVAELANPTPVGGPLAFLLVDHEPPTGEWAEVYLPIRPNGSTGLVRTAELSLSANPYRIEVDRAAHRLQVFHRGELWLDTEVAIGTGETPTPVGEFYIIELLQPPSPDGLYGPFAFGLSGFSETLTSFAGGEGVIGIHGTNQPEALGTDVSHGCIRLANDVITQLAGVIPLGTPVRIV